MSDANLDININLNTPDAKREASEIKAGVRSINEEAKKGVAPLKDREGILERIHRRINETKASAEKAQSAMSLAKHNRELQSYETELQRLSNLGRVSMERQNRLMLGQEGILQRLSRAAAIYSRGMQEATRPENLEKYSQKLALVNAEISRLTRGAGVSGSGFNSLQWNINQMTRELPAFTYSIQTGLMALSNQIPMVADDIAALRKQNEELIASGKKSIPIWRQIAGSLFSWQTVLALGVTLLTVYGREIGNFFAALFRGKEAINEVANNLKTLNEIVRDANKTAGEEISTLKILYAAATDVTKSTKERTVAAQALKKEFPEAFKNSKTQAILNGEEKKSFDELTKSIIANARARAAKSKLDEIEAKRLDIDFQRQKVRNANANEKRRGEETIRANAEALNATYSEQQKEWRKTEESIQNTVDQMAAQSDERARIALEELDSQDEVLRRQGEFLVKFAKQDELVKAIIGDGSKMPTTVPDNSDKYKSLLESIDNLDKEYARKKLDDDEAELQALRDKFSKIRAQIIEFNNDKSNTIKIDIAAFDEVQKRAEANLKEGQENERARKEREKQAELLKQALEDNATYEQRRAKIIEDAEKTITLLRSKGENDRADIARQTRDAELKELEESEARKIVLLYKGAKAQMVVTTSSIKAQIDTLRQLLASNRISDGFRAHLESELKRAENIQKLGVKAATLANFKEEQRRLTLILNSLKEAGKENTEEYKAQYQALVDLNQQATTVSGDGLQELLQMFMQIARELDVFGKSLQNLGSAYGSSTLGSIGAFLSGLASNIRSISVAFDENATKSEKYAAAVSSLIGVISLVADAAAERKRAEEEYYRSVIQLQNDYNLSLNESLRLQSELAESVYITDYVGRVKNAIESGSLAMDEYQEGIRKLLEVGRAKVGQQNKIDWGNVGSGAAQGAAIGGSIGSVIPVVGTAIGAVVGAIGGAIVGLFGGKKKKDTYAAILGEYPALVTQTADGLLHVNRELAEQLLANNMLNEETKQILNNILGWDDAMQAARQQIRDVVTELSGSLGNDLRNSLIDTFKSGEDAAISMGRTVNKVLEDILSNILFNAVFQDLFTDFEEELTNAFALGDSAKIMDAMAKFLDNAGPAGEEFYKWMEWAKNQAKSRGLDVFGPDDDDPQTPVGMSGQIERITQQQANVLEGQVGGIHMAVVQGLELRKLQLQNHTHQLDELRRSILIQIEIAENTKRVADNTDRLKNVEKHLYNIDKKMSSDAPLRAAGR